MRLTLLACVVIALIVVTAGQELSRRERLRNLIAAARSGDAEARKTLRDLRNKLRNRAQEGGAIHDEPQKPVLQPRLVEPESAPQQFEPVQAPFEEESRPVQQRFEPQLPLRRERVRPQAQRPRVQEVQHTFSSFSQPHRAINRGLEVDTRSEANARIHVTNKTRTPPIQTIRRYSYFDEEGNYIFGYETADGSFKEEKRGKDCIVHGKYGYVDPDGVKREFNYVSGNRCDPNAPTDPELLDTQQSLPRNDQFLVQTQERQLGQDALNELQINRRPRPIQQAEPELHRPRQQQPIRQPQTGVQSRRRQRIKNVVREEPLEVQDEVVLDDDPPQPSPAPQAEEPLSVLKKSPFFPPFRPAEIKPTPHVVFRPTPKPVDINFDFEQEFQQIFDNFAHTRPQARPIPIFRPPATLPPPAPLPKSTPAFSTTKPVSQKVEKPVTPKSFPPFPPQIDQPAKVPHQLVFDSATGAFKTVPLQGSSLSAAPSIFKAASPPPSKSGRPLPLPGFSPLPSVPLGSLSFGGSGTGNFDNFFRQFSDSVL